MNIKIKRDSLATALRLAGSIIDSKSPMPILGCVLLRTEGSKLRIAASNLNVWMTADLECEIKSRGDIAIPIDDLRKFVSSAAGDEVSLSTEGGWAEIKIGRSKYKARCLAGRDFPAIRPPDAKPVACSGAMLHDLLSRVTFAASKDGSRGALVGVLVEYDGKRLSMTATDGHRLAMLSRETTMASSPNGRCVLTVAGAEAIAKLVRDQDTCDVSIGGNRMATSVDGTTISAALIDLVYPPIRQVIPQSHRVEVSVDRERLLASIKRVSPLANEYHGVSFSSDGNALRLRVGDEDGQELVDEVDAEITGGSVEVCCNAKYTAECLSNLRGAAVTMHVIGPLDPVLFIDGDDLGLVMPMRE